MPPRVGLLVSATLLTLIVPSGSESFATTLIGTGVFLGVETLSSTATGAWLGGGPTMVRFTVAVAQSGSGSQAS